MWLYHKFLEHIDFEFHHSKSNHHTFDIFQTHQDIGSHYKYQQRIFDVHHLDMFLPHNPCIFLRFQVFAFRQCMCLRCTHSRSHLDMSKQGTPHMLHLPLKQMFGNTLSTHQIDLSLIPGISCTCRLKSEKPHSVNNRQRDKFWRFQQT